MNVLTRSPCSFELFLQPCGLGQEPFPIASHQPHCYSLPFPKVQPPKIQGQTHSNLGSYLPPYWFLSLIFLHNAEKGNLAIWLHAKVEAEAFHFVVFPVHHLHFHFRLNFCSVVRACRAHIGKVSGPTGRLWRQNSFKLNPPTSHRIYCWPLALRHTASLVFTLAMCYDYDWVTWAREKLKEGVPVTSKLQKSASKLHSIVGGYSVGVGSVGCGSASSGWKCKYCKYQFCENLLVCR